MMMRRRFERRAEEGFATPDGPRRQLGLRARTRAEYAPIITDESTIGIVAVPLGRPPFRLLVRELGPTMALVGGLVLVTGGGVIALVLFGPVRRRLRAVQDATERVGTGDLAARAPEDGGDEVADLARSFNRMAAELASRAQALDASDRARRQLLADVSHELMTPLTAMRGYLETLSMRDLPLDPSTRERYLGIIDDETRRLERIIGDLLDLARLEGGGTPFRRQPVDITGLFDRVASRHEHELRKRGIRLVRAVHPGATTVLGDGDRLEQALQNLAANALRHTPDDGEIQLAAEPASSQRFEAQHSEAPHSETQYSEANANVRIVVRDTGPGIPPEHLPLIFDRFYKVDASRRVAGGSGLGLSIVKTIVERHGGTITARREGGAVFEITLPAPSGAEGPARH
jgi:signal transduction histidine kinase